MMCPWHPWYTAQSFSATVASKLQNQNECTAYTLAAEIGAHSPAASFFAALRALVSSDLRRLSTNSLIRSVCSFFKLN